MRFHGVWAGSAAAALCLAAGTALAQGRGVSILPRRDGQPAGAGSGANTANIVGVDMKGVREVTFRESPIDAVLEWYGGLVGKTVIKDPHVPSVNITLESLPGQKLTREEQIEMIRVKLEMNDVHLEDYSDKFVRALPRKDVGKEGIPFIVLERHEVVHPPEVAAGAASGAAIANDVAEAPGAKAADGNAAAAAPAKPKVYTTLEFEATNELAGCFDGTVVSVWIPFSNISASDEAQKAMEGFKSNSGQLQVFERTNSILVNDTKQNVMKMVRVADMIDVAKKSDEEMFVVEIKHAAIEDIVAVLQKIVDDSMKWQEKDAKAQQNAQSSSRHSTPPPPSPILPRRPGANQAQQPAAPTSVESIVAGMSDAARGMVHGRVLIIPDKRSRKILIITNPMNMTQCFDGVIRALDVEDKPETDVFVHRLKYAISTDVARMMNELLGASQATKNATAATAQAGSSSRSSGSVNLSRGSSQSSRSAQTPGRHEAGAGELTKENTTVLADERINGVVVMTRTELVPVVSNIIEHPRS